MSTGPDHRRRDDGGTARADYEWWWDFAPTLKWTWAKTYAASAPHWYVIEGRTAGLTREDFLRIVNVIFALGEPGKFYRYSNLYLPNPRGNLKCWTMPADPFVSTDDMHVLNVATTDRTYGPQVFSDADVRRLDQLRAWVRT